MKPLDAAVDPRVLGPFELLAVIGEGGMGRAYLARRLPLERLGPELEAMYHLPEPTDDTEPDGLAVVKVIKPSLLDDGASDGGQPQRERFAQEVEAVRAVVSDRVPALLAADPEAEQPWLAIDYVHGPTLHAMVSQYERLAIGPYVAVGLALVNALRAIHDAGLLHRDLKPANVVLGPDGPVVLDFGLAVFAERRSSQALTKSNMTMGTGCYMPKEQVGDTKHVKTPADVYALGATLYFATTGKPPYPSEPLFASPLWDDVPHERTPLLAQILIQFPQSRPTLDIVEERLLELLVQHDLTPESAAEQLSAAVRESNLTPDLPPEADSAQIDPAVQVQAQRAVDLGGAPDGPWTSGADLFDELFGARIPGDDEIPEPEPALPLVTGVLDGESEPPTPAGTGAPAKTPSADGSASTAVDPAAEPFAVRTDWTPPQTVSGSEFKASPTGPPASHTAPPAALKAAERLRKAYSHSGRL
ncbi:serine/threonine protein kinase [Embleya scabrispora]|nr:serine/threonine-protein kinase [Embleya scabrispora]